MAWGPFPSAVTEKGPGPFLLERNGHAKGGDMSEWDGKSTRGNDARWPGVLEKRDGK